MSNADGMNHELIPFCFDGWEQSGDWEQVFYNVQFTDDWGPFKKNQKMNNLVVSYETGRVRSCDPDGNVIQSVYTKMVPA